MPGQSGRSRNGCFRCRARKIKCDEAQPECGRCKISGYPCPGYKSAHDVVFRSMNKTVENKVEAKKHERHAGFQQKKAAHTRQDGRFSIESILKFEEVDPAAGQEDEQKSSQQALTTRRSIGGIHLINSPQLCANVATDWENPALCRFFSDYVAEKDDVAAGPGYLNHLPKLYGEYTDDILTHAVSAVSLASFSNQVRSDELLVSARKAYGKALILVKKALESPSRITSDGTLAGVFFLNMYETISGDKPIMNQYGTHADGLSMLLALRGTSNQYTDERPGGFARAAHGVVMMKNLFRRCGAGPESDLWAESVDPTAHYAQVGLASIRIARLLPEADKILQNQTNFDEAAGVELLQVIGMFEAEERNFEIWRDGAVYPYSYGILNREALLGQDNVPDIPLPEEIHYYSDVWIAGFWNVYRFARFVLLQTLAKLADRVSMHPELAIKVPEMEQLKTWIFVEIDKMVNEICASIPFCLGKVHENGWISYEGGVASKAINGLSCIWPLRVALMVKTLSPLQKKYIFDQLRYIQGSFGVRTAVPTAQG